MAAWGLDAPDALGPAGWFCATTPASPFPRVTGPSALASWFLGEAAAAGAAPARFTTSGVSTGDAVAVLGTKVAELFCVAWVLRSPPPLVHDAHSSSAAARST